MIDDRLFVGNRITTAVLLLLVIGIKYQVPKVGKEAAAWPLLSGIPLPETFPSQNIILFNLSSFPVHHLISITLDRLTKVIYQISSRALISISLALCDKDRCRYLT